MRMLYIYLLLLSSIALAIESDKGHFTFEIVQATEDYRDILEDKKNELTLQDFDCKIVSLSEKIALYCNDTYSVKELDEEIEKFKRKNISYTIIDLLQRANRSNTGFKDSFGSGYDAYNRAEYEKAKRIFKQYYEFQESLPHSKAYALALFKLGEFDDAITVLTPYKKKREVSKLYMDMVNTYYDLLATDLNRSVANEMFDDIGLTLAEKRKFSKARKPQKASLGYGYIKKGEFEKAKIEINKLKDVSEKNSLYQALAYAYIEKKSYKEASLIIDTLEKDENRDKLNQTLAFKYIEINHLQNAQTTINRISTAAIAQPPAESLAFKYLEKGQIDNAQKLISTIGEENISDKLKQSLAFKYLDTKKLPQAQKVISTIQSDRQSATPNQTLAYRYIEQNAFTKASYIIKKIPNKQTKEKLNYTLASKAITTGYLATAEKTIAMLQSKRSKEKLNYRLANSYIRKNNLTKAKQTIANIGLKSLRDKAMLTLAYKEPNKEKRLALFEKSRDNYLHNYDFMIAYLYLLKEYNYERFKHYLAIAKQNFKKKNQVKTLTYLETGKQRDALAEYNDKNLYSECYTQAEKLLAISQDIEVSRTGAWCAYNAGKYNISRKFFQSIPQAKRNNDDLYGLALSLQKMRNNKGALATLNQIEDPYVDKNIMALYATLGETRTSKEMLLKLPDSKEKTEAIRIINGRTKKGAAISQVGGGIYYSQTKAQRGRGFLEMKTMPIDIDYITEDRKYHMYGNFELLHLSNGTLAQSDRTLFGSGEVDQPIYAIDNQGFEGLVGIKTDKYQVELGVTPSGYAISPQFVGRANGYFELGYGATLRLGVSQEVIKESYLSYVGQSAQIDGVKQEWGGVRKRGVSFGVATGGEISYSFDLLYYPKIYGKNVIDNSEYKAVATLIKHSDSEKFSFLDYGLVGIYDTFDKNSGLFTFGHGGYFSPEKLWMLVGVVDVGNYVGEDFYYRLSASGGYQTFDVADAKQLPFDATSETISGYSTSGLTTKVALQLGYNINKDFGLDGGMSWEKMYGYQLLKAGVALSYKVEKEARPSVERLRDVYKIDRLIP